MFFFFDPLNTVLAKESWQVVGLAFLKSAKPSYPLIVLDEENRKCAAVGLLKPGS